MQAYLSSRASELAAAGSPVPSAGSISERSGHHNLAFRPIGDKRWTQEQGGWDEPVAEWRPCRLPQALISTEDCSLLVSHPQGLKCLESTLQLEAHSVSWLMFLRRVDDYAES